MNSLQLENLQDYFLQNKLLALNEKHSLINFDYESFYKELNTLKNKQYNGFLYIGHNPYIILFLLKLNLDYSVEVIFGNQHVNIENFESTNFEELYVKKDGDSNFYLYTSGTTGKPKKVKINLIELLKKIKKVKQAKINWLLTYDIKSFAGLQVLLTAVKSDNKIYSTNFRSSINELIEIISSSDVNSISATPTFWRMFLNSETAKKKDLKLLTLGGEIVEEDLLLKMKKLYPDAKITQIYATTELGKIFSVHDSKAGFPYEYLEKYGLKISNNQLFVKKGSTHISTNDFVDVVGNRVIFTGRNSDFIKVAGSKVNLNMVEKKIMSFENIVDSKISFKSSKIVGKILVLDVVLNIDNEKERVILQKALRENFETFEIPKIVNFEKNIQTNTNLKKSK